VANDGAGTFELLALELGHVLEPLAGRLHDTHHALMLFGELGLRLPANSISAPLAAAMREVHLAAHGLAPMLTSLEAAIDAGEIGPIIEQGVDAARTLAELVEALDRIANEFAALGAVPSINPADMAAFAAALPQRLFEKMVVEYFEGYHGILHALLEVVGIVEHTRHNIGSSDPSRPEVLQKSLRFDRIGVLLQSPDQLLRDLYGWGDPAFDGEVLLRRVASLLRAARVPVTFRQLPGTPPRFAIEVCIASLAMTEAGVVPPGIDGMLTASIADGVTIDIPIAAGWIAHLAAEASLAARAGIRVQPPANVSVIPPSGTAQGRLVVGLGRVPESPATRMPLIGLAGGTGLSAERISMDLVIGFRAESGSSTAHGDLGFEARLQGGKLVIGMAGGDGFIGEILSGIEVEADFTLGIGWSTSQGVYFTGSSTLEIQLPAHISLGPVELDALTLSVGIDGNRFPIGLAANIKASLGPLVAVVEQIGTAVELSFPASGRGDIGPLDIDFKFKPPRGVGLSLDAGVIKGGGYLFLDFEREEYGGALELVFSEWIALKAIGLITTRMPDGSKGFSLLIIITVEFGTGFQLGFGFTLIGVGGILGLNRIVNIEPLSQGVRSGAIESVMFPKDVIANAPRIISDLRQFFPPQQDIFLVGPMAKLGWGTPTLVTAQLGVILEFPSINITILGVIKVVLPDEKADILRLQVNFIGRFEPANKLLWFYAELYDSRVLFITLEGGFGLLINWGDNANFVLSAGGFHPRYSPPPLPFPEPPRIAVSILNESFAKIRIEAYFAVTSNSVQFGARAELFFGLSEFRIEGHLAFDALFQFDPFFFSFGLSVSLSVKVFGVGLFSVGFSGLLEGPTPWYIEGKGKISLLFFKISVPFKHSWGDNKNTKLDPIEVFPLFETEFAALTNWEARLAANNKLHVSLRRLGKAESDQLVLHPVGRLRISQRKVPINFKLDKIGNKRPLDVNRVRVAAALPGSTLSVATVQDQFAIGQFRDMDGSGQLSSPGFEPLDSGIDIGVAGAALKSSRAVRRVIRYESIIVDNNFKRHVKTFFGFFAHGYAVLNDLLFTHFLKGNAVTQSVHSLQYRKRMQPFDEVITIQPTLYSVVSTTNNQPVDATATSFTSQAKALEYMGQQLGSGSVKAGTLHVIPNTELNQAA
jgi:hypothetical protein